MLLAVSLALALDDAPLARVLSACVAPTGVDYACVREHQAELRGWLAVAAGSLGAPNLGVGIDVYNALVLDQLAAAPLPRRITDVAGFFDKRYHPVDGRRLTLNELEGELRARHADPRLHFALNCGARSCPPLRGSPWPDTAAALDEALELATARFLDGPGVVVDDAARTVRLSKLFDWYAKDFAPAGGALPFVLAHVRDPARRAAVERAIQGRYAVSFQAYDWAPAVR